MEIVKKKIYKDDFITRLGGKTPGYKDGKLIGPPIVTLDESGAVITDLSKHYINHFYGNRDDKISINTEYVTNEEYNDWGVIPVNFLVNNVEIGNIPTVVYEDFMSLNGHFNEENRVIQYKTLLMYYKRLLKLIEASQYFKVCIRNGKKTYVEWKWNEKYDSIEDCFFQEKFTLYGEMPNVKERFKNEIICYNIYADEMTVMFGEDKANAYKYANNFLRMARKNLFEKHTNYSNLARPYISLGIYLEQDVEDNGIFTPNVKMWEKNKKYFLGDRVMYNLKTKYGEVYKLKKGNAFEKIRLTNFIPRDFSKSVPTNLYYSQYYYNENKKEYYLYVPYYKGYFDNTTGNVYFDTYNGSEIILEHWEMCKDRDITIEENIEGAIGSQIKELRRTTVSYDDNSNALPFIVKSTPGGPIATLPYMVGNFNAEYRNDKFITDRIETIIIYDEKGEIIVKCRTDDTPITLEYLAIYSSNYSNLSSIEFNYIRGAEIEIEGEKYKIKENTGIRFQEKYSAKIDTITIPYDGIEKCKFDYISLGDSLMEPKIYFTPNLIIEDEIYEAECYKNEALTGIQDIKYDVEGTVTRGKNGAFERHNILGEINTFEDLENYKNNLFKL